MDILLKPKKQFPKVSYLVLTLLYRTPHAHPLLPGRASLITRSPNIHLEFKITLFMDCSLKKWVRGERRRQANQPWHQQRLKTFLLEQSELVLNFSVCQRSSDWFNI